MIIGGREFGVFFNKYPKQQINMEEKTIKINVPEGYEVDEENSTFAEIKFKPIVAKYPKSWEDAFTDKMLNGYYVRRDSEIEKIYNRATIDEDKNIFKTEKQARAMLAYAQITQLMALPCYNGDWVPNWVDGSNKHVIGRSGVKIIKAPFTTAYENLAFISEEARDAFYDNHMDLLRTYFEMD